jgi:Kef-type K+ transport system membrane component KefB
MNSSVFYELAAILALAAGLGLVALALKQPLIIAFIATGVIAGPDVLGIMNSVETIDLLAEVGISALLFLVGLKLDFHLVRSLGPVVMATGLGQVVFTAVIGFALCLVLGLDVVTAIYVSVALTFSSTIIIVKLLSDKREIDMLHGRIAIGFLIVQDVVVIVAMIALSTLGASTSAHEPSLGIANVILRGVLLLVGIAMFVRYAAEPLIRRIARMPDLLITFAIAWAVVLAAVCDYAGLGKELGGLLAGVSLATTSFRESIASRLASVRDFLLLFFFLALGRALHLTMLSRQVPVALVLSTFVLIGNPLIVMIIMGMMGYRKRTGFLAGLTVAQISEFSLIFMAMGVSLGHVTEDSMGLVTLVGIITITLSTYMIQHSNRLYSRFEPYLSPFERRAREREVFELRSAASGEEPEAVVFGLGGYGGRIVDILSEVNIKVLGVDDDPDIVRAFRMRDIPVVYGDASDPALPQTLSFSRVRWVVIAMSPSDRSMVDADSRWVLMKTLREAGYHGCIAIRSNERGEMERLRAAGADVILEPLTSAASQAVEILGYVRDHRRPVRETRHSEDEESMHA